MSKVSASTLSHISPRLTRLSLKRQRKLLGSAHLTLPRGLERRVTPLGNSAKVDCPKKYPFSVASLQGRLHLLGHSPRKEILNIFGVVETPSPHRKRIFAHICSGILGLSLPRVFGGWGEKPVSRLLWVPIRAIIRTYLFSSWTSFSYVWVFSETGLNLEFFFLY